MPNDFDQIAIVVDWLDAWRMRNVDALLGLYTENAIVHGGRLDLGVELLSTPYLREMLARKVRQVMAKK